MNVGVTGCRLILCCAVLLGGAFSAVAGTPGPQEASAEGMAAIQRIIHESEYHLSWQDQTVLQDLDQAWHAPNRAHNLRFYFTEGGLRVVDRTAQDSPELLLLTLPTVAAPAADPVPIAVSDQAYFLSLPRHPWCPIQFRRFCASRG